MLTRLARWLPGAVSALALLCGFGCQRSTEREAPQVAAEYVWSGTAVDSLTGAGVGGLLVSVREKAEHAKNGWGPYEAAEALDDGRFQVSYYLFGIWPCSSFPDTTLTVHLDFVDPQGRYEAASHETDSFRVCPRRYPPLDQLPADWERHLRIALARR